MLWSSHWRQVFEMVFPQNSLMCCVKRKPNNVQIWRTFPSASIVHFALLIGCFEQHHDFAISSCEMVYEKVCLSIARKT